MSIARLFKQTVIVTTVGVANDTYGNEVAAPGATFTTQCFLQATSSVETLLDRDTTTTHWSGFFPWDVALHAMDTVTYGAHVLQVTGYPAPQFNPRTGTPSHQEVLFTEVT